MTYLTSTYVAGASLRQIIRQLQTELTRSQKEVATGRNADPGAALGLRASQAFAIAGAQESIDAMLATNRIVGARLDATQASLSSLLADAEVMRKSLIAAQDNGGQSDAISGQARQALTTFIATLNATNGDGFLFGGVNVDRPPLNDYFADPAPSSKQALGSAFQARFGFPPSSESVAAISPAQIEAFLSGAFKNLFSAANWKSDWSHATDSAQISQIGIGNTIESSVTANDPAMSTLAAAYTMMSDIGAQKMGHETYAAVLGAASATLDAAIGLLTRAQARVGVMQQSLQAADVGMSAQSDLLQTQLHDLVAADQNAAATTLQGLMTQIETAFTLTARISQLSLTKYL